jgi:TetR/AcrR family transcriptional regulator, transcriptional repressor for nem operon
LTYIPTGLYVICVRQEKTSRTPEATRQKILMAAFHEFYKHGFQGGSLNHIVETAGTTKGALFHHFAGKQDLGYAVVDEVIGPLLQQRWLAPVADALDPISALKEAFRLYVKTDIDSGSFVQGCPLNNLAQEMSPLDAGFRKRLAIIFDAWREAVASTLREGQTHGSVRCDAEPADAAGLLIAMVEGYASLAKNAQDPKIMKAGIRNIVDWLRSLRPSGNRKRV